MVELCARILIAAGLFAAGAQQQLDFTLAWKMALASLAVGGFAYRLELRGFRNSGVAGFIAVADSAMIALLVGSVNALPEMGFLVLIPVAFAVRYHGAPANYVAPLSAAAVLGAYVIRYGMESPPVGLFWQLAGALAVGLLLAEERVVAAIAKPVQAEVYGTVEAKPDGFLELRENYRKLRESYQDLQGRAKRDHAAVLLSQGRDGSTVTSFSTLADQITELTGAQSVVIYSTAGYGRALVVRATVGDLPPETATTALDVDINNAPVVIRDQVNRATRALRPDAAAHVNTVLTRGGKVIGMVTLGHSSQVRLEEALQTFEDASDQVAAIVHDVSRRIDSERRLKESELLYEIATLAEGSESRAEVAGRFVKEVAELLAADHVGVFLIDGDETLLLAKEGRDVRLLEQLSFAGGPGMKGWLGIGGSELLMFDVREDSRCPNAIALKARVGSYFLCPLMDGHEIYGFVTAACDRNGGLDLGAAESLRTVTGELASVLIRFDGRTNGEIVTPVEFKKALHRKGCLVVMDPLRKEQMTNTYGRPALTHALRRFARQIRAKLPEGGVICRRQDGDLLVFLPSMAEAAAISWANEMAASASLMALRTPDGSARVPFAVRAKVAVLHSQFNQIYEEAHA